MSEGTQSPTAQERLNLVARSIRSSISKLLEIAPTDANAVLSEYLRCIRADRQGDSEFPVAHRPHPANPRNYGVDHAPTRWTLFCHYIGAAIIAYKDAHFAGGSLADAERAANHLAHLANTAMTQVAGDDATGWRLSNPDVDKYMQETYPDEVPAPTASKAPKLLVPRRSRSDGNPEPVLGRPEESKAD